MLTHSSVLAWKSHGQTNLAVYSLWGHKELDTRVQATELAHMYIISFLIFRQIACNIFYIHISFHIEKNVKALILRCKFVTCSIVFHMDPDEAERANFI